VSDTAPVTTRCGHVALIGAPNSGKSTLLNRLVGSKLAIVTPKVQTTRARMLGIVIDGNAQMIFVDTPGIFEPKRRLERAMVKAAWASAHDAENIVVLVDAARGLDADTGRIIDGLRDAKRRAVLALNKVDKVKRGDLLPLAQALDHEGVFDRIFMISGLTGDGVEDLKVYLANALPRGPWLYPEDEITDVPLRLLAAEATREQIFRQLHQELPYSATVETEKWEDRPDGSVRIDQVVHVTREGQKAIVVGADGRQIKSIGASARADLEVIFQRRVHLFIQVRVTENWTEDRERYAAMRLDFEE